MTLHQSEVFRGLVVIFRRHLTGRVGDGSNRATVVLGVHPILVRPNRRDCQQFALSRTLLQPSVARSHLQVILVAHDATDAARPSLESPCMFPFGCDLCARNLEVLDDPSILLLLYAMLQTRRHSVLDFLAADSGVWAQRENDTVFDDPSRMSMLSAMAPTRKLSFPNFLPRGSTASAQHDNAAESANEDQLKGRVV